MLAQAPAHGARLLGAQVKRHVLLALVEEAQLGALVGVDDGQDAGDALSHIMTTPPTNISIETLHLGQSDGKGVGGG